MRVGLAGNTKSARKLYRPLPTQSHPKRTELKAPERFQFVYFSGWAKISAFNLGNLFCKALKVLSF